MNEALTLRTQNFPDNLNDLSASVMTEQHTTPAMPSSSREWNRESWMC